MGDQNSSRGNGTAQIDPFSDGFGDTIDRLMNEVSAVREAVGKLGLPADPKDTAVKEKDAALEERVTALVARYELPENDRHPAISQPAEAAAKEIKNLERSRASMGAAYALTAGAMCMNLVRLKGDQVGAAIEHFTNNMKRNAAMSDIPQTVEHSIQSTDKASRERIGRYTAVCGLAGAMIDAGNQYLDLNARRRATLEFYANGREPKGWSQRLPGPLKSILSESAWRNFEQVAAILGKEGIWHFTSPIPFDVVVVLPARVVWEIRKERVREQQAYRRGDVDELLDLADQLARASDGVDQLRGSITEISQAATAIKKVS